MKLTNPEKLILIMLSDIHKKLGIQEGIDPNFVESAIYSDNTWGFEWKYTGVFASASEPTRPEVTEVLNYLDMWELIEIAYSHLDEEGKKELATKVDSPFGKNVEFRGFDGNNESEYIGITRFLVNDLERFVHFKGREGLNSHMPVLGIYRRMYQVFEPLRRTLINKPLSVDQLAVILKSALPSEGH